MTNRYCIAKQYRNHGRQFWGVYDLNNRAFVEGGFRNRAEALKAAGQWNMAGK